MAKNKVIDTKPPDIFETTQQYVARMEKLYAAESKALAAVELADTAAVDGRKRESSRLAKAFIDSGEMPAQSGPTKEEAHLAHCRAVLLGIRREISTCDADLLSLRERFEATRQEHAQKVVSNFLATEFQPALDAFQGVRRRAAALGEALDLKLDPRSPIGLSSVFQLPDFTDWADR